MAAFLYRPVGSLCRWRPGCASRLAGPITTLRWASTSPSLSPSRSTPIHSSPLFPLRPLPASSALHRHLHSPLSRTLQHTRSYATATIHDDPRLPPPPQPPPPKTTSASSGPPDVVRPNYLVPFLITLVATGFVVSQVYKITVGAEYEEEIEEEEEEPYEMPAVTEDYVPEPIAPRTLAERVMDSFYFVSRVVQISVLFSPLLLAMPLAYFSTTAGDFWWRYLRLSLETLGGAWIKLGQWASTRPDLFSQEFIDHLIVFQRNSPSHSWNHTLTELKTAFENRPLSSIFASFDRKPIASGAIAQVHRARLVTGENVAVKVLHPNMTARIYVDLRVMRLVAHSVSMFPGTGFLDLRDALSQFSATMKSQANLNSEGRNLLEFGKYFKDNKRIVFPKYYSSTPHVLVESYEEAIPLSKFLGERTELSKNLAKMGLDAYLQMMLVDNFVHADLHPGNIAVKHPDDPQDRQLVLFDVGLVTRASPQHFRQFRELFGAIVNGDGEKGAELMVRYSKNSNNISEDDVARFSTEMGALFNQVSTAQLQEIRVGDVLYGMLSLVRKYGVHIEGNFSTLCVGTIILEGIGKQLDPEINLMGRAVPFLLKGNTNLGDVVSLVPNERLKEVAFGSQPAAPAPAVVTQLAPSASAG